MRRKTNHEALERREEEDRERAASSEALQREEYTRDIEDYNNNRRSESSAALIEYRKGLEEQIQQSVDSGYRHASYGVERTEVRQETPLKPSRRDDPNKKWFREEYESYTDWAANQVKKELERAGYSAWIVRRKEKKVIEDEGTSTIDIDVIYLEARW